MLKGIDPLLTPELLKVLAEMGHGDEIVIADANFTAATLGRGKTLIQAPGIGVLRMCEAVLSLLPLDAAVARAAAFAEHVVILDEPTAALGVKEGNMVLELIRRVRDKGLPVILISHNMPHVFEIADRIHVARLGRRAAILNPKKISMSDTVAVMTGAMPPEQIPAECLAH